MPHQPRFEWQLWFSSLGQLDSEYYLVHYLYKLFNNDTIAKSLLQHDPFHGSQPKYLKIDMDHYQFTDFKKEKVTFGLKTILTRVPFLLSLLPVDIQRYFKNEKVQ